jgi:hypothetical protein
MAGSVRIIDNRELFSVVRDELLEGNTVRVAVRGQSMLPFFMSGSTIELRPVAYGDIRKYNVVLADAGRSFVVHRIIAVDNERVTLLGDGNIIGTEVVEREKIYGVVDCSRLHIALAKVWVWLRPVRRYPLAILRRVCPK